MCDDETMVTLQMGRRPREPWRVARRCVHGRPAVIVSPPVLDDGARFPTWAWLTCPHLVDAASVRESAGEIAMWNARLASEPALAGRLASADRALRRMRALEGGGEDVCAGDGVAGRRSPAGVKCLHAHVALFLAGIPDPIGEEVSGVAGVSCEADRCARLRPGEEAS